MCRNVFGIKIGRTYDVDKRCKTLARSMPFRMKLLAEFPECADLEFKLHEHLSDRRNTNGLGRKWFHVEPGEAIRLIRSLMGANTKDANRPSSGSASSG